MDLPPAGQRNGGGINGESGCGNERNGDDCSGGESGSDENSSDEVDGDGGSGQEKVREFVRVGRVRDGGNL